MGQCRVPRSDADRGYHYFPAFLDLVRKNAVVVGGGRVAASKVDALLPCGVACLTVVAPEVCSRIAEAATAGRLRWLKRHYQVGDLANADVVLAATDNRALNAEVACDARQAGILVLAVDDVANCDFVAPALVRRGDLVIAISTQGGSPAIARWVREWLDDAVPAHWSALLDIAAEVRLRLGPLRQSISPAAWQTALRATDAMLRDGGDPTPAADYLAAQLSQTVGERAPH